jgi:hypothetical protein
MGGGEIGNTLASLRYLATWLGPSDHPPSAFLLTRGKGSADELAILGDVGELTSLNFDLIGEFDIGTLTGEGLDGILTGAVSGEVSNCTGFPSVGSALGLGTDSSVTFPDELGIISIGISEELLLPGFPFWPRSNFGFFGAGISAFLPLWLEPLSIICMISSLSIVLRVR